MTESTINAPQKRLKAEIEKGKRYFAHPLKFAGAGGRNRTDMSLRSLDFESSASTNFTTPARF
jgi:hypothetical protein